MKKVDSIVEDIYWERIYIHIRVHLPNTISEGVQCYLITEQGMAETVFDLVAQEQGGYYRFRLNITNSGINRCINQGTYKLFLTNEKDFYSVPVYLNSIDSLLGLSRCFRYKRNLQAYTVTFIIDEYSEKPELLLQFYNLRKTPLGNMVSNTKVGNSAATFCDLRTFKNCRNYFRRVFGVLFGNRRKNLRKLAKLIANLAFHLKTKKEILFLSAQQNDLPLNMKVLYERMQQRSLSRDWKIRTSLYQATVTPLSILEKFVQLVKIGRADVIIIDDHVPWFDWFVLDQTKHKLIQIWHAGAGFKGVGFSRWGHFGCPGPFNCHRQYTYCVCDSPKIAHFFSEQFGILPEQVIPTGMPRLDLFLSKSNRLETEKELLQRYPQFKSKTVILFAPTYRGQNKASAYYPYDLINFSELYDYCQKTDSIVLFKMHPWVSESVPIEDKYLDSFIDLSKYKNINDLFYITDILITDYSSNMYEFALMNKPMLTFAFDLEQYSASRGFHRNYEENVPGKVCRTFDELIISLINKDFQYEKHNIYMKNHFDKVDVNNSDRIIDWLVLDQLPKEYKQALVNKEEMMRNVKAKSFGAFIERKL